MAPDTWIAPNAVVVGDVDLYEKVMQLVQPHTHVLTLQLVDWLPKHAAATGAERIELVIAPAWHHWLCSAAQASTKLLMRDARPHGGMPPNATARRPCFSLLPLSLSPSADLHLVWLCAARRPELSQGRRLLKRAGPHSDTCRSVRLLPWQVVCKELSRQAACKSSGLRASGLRSQSAQACSPALSPAGRQPARAVLQPAHSKQARRVRSKGVCEVRACAAR